MASNADDGTKLVILALRPMYFVTVKRSFAEIWVNRRTSVEASDVLVKIRRCSGAARKNLRIARWMLSVGRARRLLQAGLHHIFNGAIILMLQEMVCTNLAPTDIEDILWTTQVFEDEARTGNMYARDCAKILQDMRSLVVRLKAPFVVEPPDPPPPPPPPLPLSQLPIIQSDPNIMKLHTPIAMPAPADSSANHSSNEAMMQSMQWQLAEGDALWQELMTWMEIDEMQMYNNYIL